MLNLQQRFRRNDNFVFRRIDDETILVPIKNNVGDMGCIYTLNSVGAFIWQHMDGGCSLAAIADDMCQEFEVSTQEATADLLDFVSQLTEIDAALPLGDERIPDGA